MKKLFICLVIMCMAVAPVFAASDTEETPKMDTISEKTSGSGVTIDGVLLKDGAVPASAIPDDSVDGDALADVVDASSADQACDTTCGIANCYFGFDAGSSVIVDCADATADTCACDGAIA